MSTGILLITHDKIGSALVDTAKMILQQAELPISLVEAPADCDVDDKVTEAQQHIEHLGVNADVIILNDIYGATPYNIAQQLKGKHVAVLTGLNLNMLLRALTYQHLPLADVLEKASDGGTGGVRYEP